MTVRNWITSRLEKYQFISPDGEVYNFHDPVRRAVISMDGWGMPAADIAGTRGAFQHGITPTSVRIPPRKIQMQIRSNRCSRNDYWEARGDLIDILRLNRANLNDPSPGALRWYRSDGEIRQIDVFVTKGPAFPTRADGWDSFGFSDSIEFTAYNPIIYDPTQINQSFPGLICTTLTQLQFPFTFEKYNIIFGGSTCYSEIPLSVNYVGTWMEFPQIVVGGPVENFSITHDQTGLKLEFDSYIIAAGEVVTFDLTYGRKTITNNSGTSLLGELSTASDLGLFSILPDPLVANGLNTFTISVTNSSADTYVIFRYYNRYIGM